MELKVVFFLVQFALILCGFLFQESSGLHLPSFSLASVFLPINVKPPEFSLYGKRQRYLLLQNDHELSHPSTHGHKGHGKFAAPPHLEPFHAQQPIYHPSTIPSDPHPPKVNIPSDAYAPSKHSTSSPLVSRHKHHHLGKKVHHIAPEPYHESPRASYSRKGPLPLPVMPSNHQNGPSPSPTVSPLRSPMINDKKTLPPLPSVTFPPPPPNQGCVSIKCTEPLTYTPPGAPCGCVWPIQVRLRFSMSLYMFFPLVSNLAEEIAASIPLNRSQVRIMGADAADQQLDETTVLINLVPLDETFKSATALSIYRKFWRRELSIKSSVFGTYEVLYVQYPGLPPSPPSRPSGSATIYVPSGRDNDEPVKPLGVDVPRRRRNDSDKNMVVIVVLSSVTAFVVCMGFVLLLLLKCGCCSYLHRQQRQHLTSSDRKTSGVGRLLTLRSGPSSPSMSFGSSLLGFTGTAKVFTIDDVERATDKFDSSRTLGEGGFGLVYGGVLDDGRKVAVKVLKRGDQQGSREFLAEVEMLSRLHHRNLVKLIGICAEEQCRCLIYELVPNGSVESHLHGNDKDIAPLDWCARMKIALGAARGLAYLHEDSSPRVIHRDFKSSNILLEHDYMPKVSDFGLARAAMDEGNKHISTHVMGTFGYLAPEYAMTGHLLVKSDVYSYGVVLLELLTGRKPVDLLQPPGQENLVSWARPLLTTQEGLEMIIDPSLKPNIPLESFSKVAAIASMCVQPEVSHRPFMGEVVQALKLVCNEFEETREELFIDMESKHSRITNELEEDLEKYDSGFDTKIALSAVDLKSVSVNHERQESESFRREFNSAPLKAGRKQTFWKRLRGLSRGSMSEHEYSSMSNL